MGLNPSMKFFFGAIFTLLVFTVVIGGGALIWYLSQTTELSRNEAMPTTSKPISPNSAPIPPVREPGGR